MKPSCWVSKAAPTQCEKYSKAHQRQYNEKKSWDYDHDDNANTNIACWDNLSNNWLDISRKPELTIRSGRQVSIDHHQKPGKTLNELSQAFRFVFSSTWLQGTECRPFLSPRRQSKQSKCHLPLAPDIFGRWSSNMLIHYIEVFQSYLLPVNIVVLDIEQTRQCSATFIILQQQNSIRFRKNPFC